MDKHLIAYAAGLFAVETGAMTNTAVRTRPVVRARSALVWVLWKLHPTWSQLEIAQAAGMADRKSMVQAQRRAERLRREDEDFQQLLEILLIAPRVAPAPALPPPAAPQTRGFDTMAIWTIRQRGGFLVRAA